MRLGDLDALKVHISELMLIYSGTELDNAILNAIDNAPTVETPCNDCCADTYRDGYEKGKADARPQGEWLDHGNNIECDQCHVWFLKDHLIRKSFCPNCGAGKDCTKLHIESC